MHLLSAISLYLIIVINFIHFRCCSVIYLQRTHNSTEVQHVHITETPFNYVQSQHTVYSFHSQTLCEEGGDSLKLPTTAQNGHPKTALSKINGRVLELRPVASMPSDMENRYFSPHFNILHYSFHRHILSA